ncbi:hypothetical protein [Alicyclobacillus fodiniaquatilis]|uniref:Uncharacterized protein n=1 Tax=Alicyclobacillus fodiniaquatilis TaxID=1661150 RepID=A0ABW4JLC8_9BACL
MNNLACRPLQSTKNAYEIQIFAPENERKDVFLRLSSLLELFILTNHTTVHIPVSEVNFQNDDLLLHGAADGFAASAVWTQKRGHCDYFDVDVNLTYTGEVPLEFGVRVNFDLIGPGRPRWMIPGAFYKENRFAHNARQYPRYDFDGGDPAQMVSDHWAFRADRAALPAVFAWNEEMCAALCVDETSALGLNGVGFKGNQAGTSLCVNFPYREEPIVFDGEPIPQPAEIQTALIRPGEQVQLQFRVYVGSADVHAYDPFVRTMYELHQQVHPLNPWMDIKEAAELTAHGLYRWHYHPEHDILYETAAFDRELNNNVNGLGDRAHMHVAWVSGAPYAYALLTYGRDHDRPEYIEAAIRVLNKVASGIAPNGTFWAQWTVKDGWNCGWNPHRDWLQARTIAEATLFMARAVLFERERGHAHPEWDTAVLSNLRFARDVQRADGNFGSYYQCETGDVVEWDGAGGVLWIAALVEGAKVYPEEAFDRAATRGGAYYEKFVQDAFIYGAPEDVHLTPTSEDAYNAVVAYVLLYEQENQLERWLTLAKHSANWMMTFRWTYNLAFPKHSLLAQYDFRSRGADQASPSNQHLHNYGLFCLPEMMRLWHYTKDTYYLERTRDLLFCFLQFIAREDGDFNAYKGMVTERYYNTNCFQPKGMLVTLSHAWCIGVTLYACQAAESYRVDLLLEDEAHRGNRTW